MVLLEFSNCLYYSQKWIRKERRKMIKVIINKCNGSFDLSDRAREELKTRGVDYKGYSMKKYDKSFRCSAELVEVVEELGPEADGEFSNLKVIEIPFDGLEGWHILTEEFGSEAVHEDHKTWE
jgi:hypothetical protein